MLPEKQQVQTKNNLLAFALKYLKHYGINVIPARGKIPAVSWAEYQSRKITEEELKKSWFEGANIAAVCGTVSGGIVVVDADSSEAIAELKKRGLPRTCVVKTRRGFHYYFRTSKVVKSGKLTSIPEVDVKGEGSVVILPPSIHPEGTVYTWYSGLSPRNIAIAPLPEWIEKETGSSSSIAIKSAIAGVEQGQRNVSLTRLIGTWLKNGFDYQECLTLALLWNKLNKPPLSEKEIITTLKSIYSRELKFQQEVNRIKKSLQKPHIVEVLKSNILGVGDDILRRISIADILNTEEERNV